MALTEKQREEYNKGVEAAKKHFPRKMQTVSASRWFAIGFIFTWKKLEEEAIND